MEIRHIRINHLDHPTIDTDPEFSFHVVSDYQNVFTVFWQITVSSEGREYWNSGKREGSSTSFLPYEGDTLESNKRYDVTVTSWNNHGEQATGQSYFETGLFAVDWKAEWIECPFERNEHHMLSDGIMNPVLSFKRNITVNKTVKRAKLYATCYGVYRPLLNGERIDDREFAPEFTAYASVLYYQTYDVTEMLNTGINELEFLVGDGWYFNQQTATVGSHVLKPALLYQLMISYEDGSNEIKCSDGTETCQETNIIYSDLYVGEMIDLTKPYGEIRAAGIKDYGYSQLCAQKMEPVKAVEEFQPVNIFKSPKNELIVDFGQVIAGRCRIHLKEGSKKKVTLEHTEVLDRDGNYFAALSARQRDIVICDGKEGWYEPMFTFHGFRYVRISGLDNISEADITARLYSTAKENIGSFRCSDERFNRLYENIRYSQRNNTMSIPTDCPQREKAGWTGDVLIYGKTSLLNEGMLPFYESWLNGLKHDQYDNGAVPIVSPYTKLYEFVVNKTMKDFDDSKPTGIIDDMLPKDDGKHYEERKAGVAGWSDAMVWLPYAIYQISGDRGILRRYYEPMKKWADNIIFTAASRRNENIENAANDRYLWNTGFHFGEWLVYGHVVPGFEITRETSWYTAPMFGYQTIKLFAEIQQILGEDNTYYMDICQKMKRAIQEEVLNIHNEYDSYMGRYILALAFDLTDGKLKEQYEQKLIELIEENNGRLATGFLATPFILDVLDKIGRHDLAKGILLSDEMPSWLYEVKMGATTIWENWNAIETDGTPNQTSYDHYAFGVVDDYLFHEVCGIHGDTGFRHLVIDPDMDYGFDSLYRSILSENGLIEMGVNNNTISVNIPCNTTAEIYWKGECHKVGSGKYQW
ncbi:MAG: family 78 glycoside hydrolase catalytic domain [Erysipelotrichaceae bacterium]|nr:family 78 glycoside hydrolase catalytic domain [Erysipelotrichaceae bacterium]MBQ4457322.1 family 78 glycoside hydrolase catalytic domain [Clostridia bacterium]